MKINPHIRVAVSAALALSLLLATTARAQNAAPVRVVRLSRAEGQVLVSHAGSNIWEEAPVNLPLVEGDTLATQDGLAGVEFENGATAYVAENSVLQFTKVGFSATGRTTELTLTQGAGTFYANLTTQDSFLVHTSTFDVAIPTRAEFRIDAFLDGAAAEVFLGNVTVTTTRGSTDLVKGQSVAVHAKDFQDMSVGSLPTAEDAFDQWVTKEGEIIRSGNKNTLTYINSPNTYGLADLSMYGSWIGMAEFGGFAWRPFSLGLSWTPFMNGTWRLDPLLGWIWVSSEPWGWTPYHFGSWLLSPALGWVWVPGGAAGLAQWQAARVNWVRNGNQVGWVPISPNDRDGVPANAAHGVITLAGPTQGTVGQHNQLIPTKDLHGVTLLKQPPPEFDLHTEVASVGLGTRSTVRVVPRERYESGPIVMDQQSHTFVNGEPAEANTRANPPIAPAVPMPQFNKQTGVPRATPQPVSPAAPSVNRVLRPSLYLPAPASRGSLPAYGGVPARPTVMPPPGSQPRPAPPQSPTQPAAVPRQVAPQPAPVRSPEPPASPRPAHAQAGSPAAGHASPQARTASPSQSGTPSDRH